MTALRVYFDGDSTWCIASSPADALAGWCEHTGENQDFYSAQHWKPLDDEKLLRIHVESDGSICEVGDGEVVELKAREWVERHGRGFLASTEH